MVSIKTILILNIILLCLALIYYFRVEITGFVSDVATVSLSIGGAEVRLTIYNEKSKYCPNESATIANIIQNTGILDTSGNLSTTISSPDGEVILSDNWNNIDLPIDETKEFRVYLNFSEDNTTGLYGIQSSFVYYDSSSDTLQTETDTAAIRFNKGIGTLTASPPEIEKSIKRGNSAKETISMWLRNACENTNVTVNTSSGEPGNWTSISEDLVFLTPTILNTTEVNITVPQDAFLGDYGGEIVLTAEDQKISIPLIIHVIREDLKINVTVTAPDEEVCLGKVVDATVNFTKVPIGEELLLNVTYQILDPDSINVANSSEQILINDTVMREPSLSIPISSSVGFYTYFVTLEHEEITDQNSDIFEVVDCRETETPIEVSEGEGGGGGGPAPAAPGKPLNYSMKLELSTNIISSIPGDKETFLATVTNDGNVDLETVRLSVKGVPSNWIKVIPNEVDIPYSKSQEYLVVLDIPNNAAAGKYRISIKAVSMVDSEIKTIKLIIGKTLEELANLLLEEMEERRAIARRTIKTDACLDISEIISIFNEAERAREKGLENYKSKNYEKAIDWLEHAIGSYNKVIDQVDIKIELKINSLKKERIGVFPILGLKEQIGKLELYYLNRNYERICGPIIEIARLKRLSLIFWIVSLLLVIISVIVLFILYRRRKRSQRKEVISRVRERLGEFQMENVRKPDNFKEQ